MIELSNYYTSKYNTGSAYVAPVITFLETSLETLFTDRATADYIARDTPRITNNLQIYPAHSLSLMLNDHRIATSQR